MRNRLVAFLEKCTLSSYSIPRTTYVISPEVSYPPELCLTPPHPQELNDMPQTTESQHLDIFNIWTSCNYNILDKTRLLLPLLKCNTVYFLEITNVRSTYGSQDTSHWQIKLLYTSSGVLLFSTFQVLILFTILRPEPIMPA